MSALLIDTNLLCLLATGLCDTQSIRHHKRLQIYDREDFERVVWLVERHATLVLCPHVLAETSNLVRQTNDKAARAIGAMLAMLIARASEARIASTDCAGRPEYARLGLTDAVLLELAAGGHTLLSDDAVLCHASAARGYRTINYNHVRDGAVRLDQLHLPPS